MRVLSRSMSTGDKMLAGFSFVVFAGVAVMDDQVI